MSDGEGGAGRDGKVRQFARWSGFGNNKRKDIMADRGTVQDEEWMEGAGEPQAEQPAGVGLDVSEAEDRQAAETAAGPGAASSRETELEQMRAERDGLRDRLARLQAEFDNARKRESKERQDARDYAVTKTVEPFLGVMDNFGLALKAEGSAEQLKQGVEMILRQMEDALRGLNVQAVPTVGTQFDPRLHEALGSTETKEFPDHQVIEEIRRGYQIRDKLLRPALVRIASNPGQVDGQA